MNKTKYTKDGLIILPPNVLIPKDFKRPELHIIDFTQIQQKRQEDYYEDLMDELKSIFSFGEFNPTYRTFYSNNTKEEDDDQKMY